jgi:hypothetical protein
VRDRYRRRALSQRKFAIRDRDWTMSLAINNHEMVLAKRTQLAASERSSGKA